MVQAGQDAVESGLLCGRHDHLEWHGWRVRFAHPIPNIGEGIDRFLGFICKVVGEGSK